MAEDTREDLERESRGLTKFHDKLLAEAKTFEADMPTLENVSLKELTKLTEIYDKHAMLVAASYRTFDAMSEELTPLKKHKDKFEKKKKAFRKDLDVVDTEINKTRPKLLDQLELKFNACMTAATNLQNKATELTGVFPQVAGEVGKLNARIKTFNDSLSPKDEKIKPVEIKSPDLAAYPPKLKEILTKLGGEEADIKGPIKDLKRFQKEIKDTIDRLEQLQPEPAKPAKPVKK